MLVVLRLASVLEVTRGQGGPVPLVLLHNHRLLHHDVGGEPELGGAPVDQTHLPSEVVEVEAYRVLVLVLYVRTVHLHCRLNSSLLGAPEEDAGARVERYRQGLSSGGNHHLAGGVEGGVDAEAKGALGSRQEEPRRSKEVLVKEPVDSCLHHGAELAVVHKEACAARDARAAAREGGGCAPRGGGVRFELVERDGRRVGGGGAEGAQTRVAVACR
mmetsp:Transcript_53860/g.128014  ORF Transcript_53860/g.128014 Transcript_53860/m.128014 type:complete len:216 (+) Transcript_53860:2662-3309(+)